MLNMTPAVRISLGLVALTVSLILGADAFLGLFPKQADPLQSPGHGPLGPAGQVHLLQTASARFDPVITGRTELRKPAAM